MHVFSFCISLNSIWSKPDVVLHYCMLFVDVVHSGEAASYDVSGCRPFVSTVLVSFLLSVTLTTGGKPQPDVRLLVPCIALIQDCTCVAKCFDSQGTWIL